MALISMQNISIGFGGHRLLDGINLQIEPDERICLVGRNGEGKSTLLKLIEGDALPDSGRIIRKPGIRVSRLGQHVPEGLDGTVYDIIAGGMKGTGGLLAEYHKSPKSLKKVKTVPSLANLIGYMAN